MMYNLISTATCLFRRVSKLRWKWYKPCNVHHVSPSHIVLCMGALLQQLYWSMRLAKNCKSIEVHRENESERLLFTMGLVHPPPHHPHVSAWQRRPTLLHMRESGQIRPGSVCLGYFGHDVFVANSFAEHAVSRTLWTHLRSSYGDDGHLWTRLGERWGVAANRTAVLLLGVTQIQRINLAGSCSNWNTHNTPLKGKGLFA